MSRLGALLAGRCPRCLRGPVWRSAFSTYGACPVCALRYEREPGYWTGAMVASYVLGIPVLAVVFAVVWLVTRWDVVGVLIASDLVFLAVAPLVWRYSRVAWLHFDWLVDPEMRRDEDRRPR
jgi:uncharacterized protein (DUF983 family)